MQIKLTKEEKVVAKIMGIILAVVLVIGFCMVIEGCSDNQSTYGWHSDDCGWYSRIEKVFPFHRLGCWLGEKE